MNYSSYILQIQLLCLHVPIKMYNYLLLGVH